MLQMNTSKMELPSIIDQNYKTFVPKIRIRLRPNSDQIKDSCQSNGSGIVNPDLSESENGTINPSDEIILVSDTACYKIMEDSRGGSDNLKSTSDIRHNYMLHGINLRARLPKPLNISKKLKVKENGTNEQKRKKSEEVKKEFINKSICTKNTYKSFMHNSSKNHQRKEKNNRKSISKIRIEILQNINLKDIVNQDNFVKLSSEMQWHLVNLLPNCDKPKSEESATNCNCPDVFSTINEQHRLNPNINFTALNNEFFWRALHKYSVKMGQCDLINLLVSERENLRSRPVTLLNGNNLIGQYMESKIKVENVTTGIINNEDNDIEQNNDNENGIIKNEEIKSESIKSGDNTNEDNKNNDKENYDYCNNEFYKNCEMKDDDNVEDDNKINDDVISNSSVCTTETVEMNGTGNLFENMSLHLEQNRSYGTKSTSPCEINNVFDGNTPPCDCDNEIASLNEKYSADDSQCDKIDKDSGNVELQHENSVLVVNNLHHQLGIEYNKMTQLSIDTNSVCYKIDSSERFENSKKKRGRKRKSYSVSDDIVLVPVKRSNRSTAGKRPARLDSESPPTSPNQVSNLERKNINIHNKLKKQTKHNRTLRKCKRKQELSSDEFDNIKMESKSKILILSDDNLKYPKNDSWSPESLPTESDLSPLSKPSPNGSSLLGSFCRSNLTSLYNEKKTSSHITSVQELSPSWSCTSESTNSSLKSDCEQMSVSKVSPTLISSTLPHPDMNSVSNSETKTIQGMPPPRQTLTLAAMREKLRAKKLAKEDNRKDNLCPSERISSTSHPKYNKNNFESSSLLKEGDDEFQLMDKMMTSSEEFDDLLNNSQESLLDFFMGDDTYDFDSNNEQCSHTCTSSENESSVTKSHSQHSLYTEDGYYKNEEMIMSHNCEEVHLKNESPLLSPVSKVEVHSRSSISRNCSNPVSDESIQSNKSMVDTIATVLHKFNCSKETYGTVVNSTATKCSVPNAYLVDGNGLSTALSIIQSLNPGAKVTTQQFYLVNSGPQLFLQPSPSNNVVPDKVTPVTSNTVTTSMSTPPSKVYLAPKIPSNQSSSVRQPPLFSNSQSSANDGFGTMSLNQFSFVGPSVHDKSINLSPDSVSSQLRTSCMKNTYMVSSITHNVPHLNHLQTISSPHPIGLVHSVQAPPPPLPPSSSSSSSLFSNQLRFLHPSLTGHNSSNTISLIGAPNVPPVPGSAPGAGPINQSSPPKLLLFCPTLSSNSISAASVLNQDQKYLLLSKQPDKQATIQVLSSQALWHQLTPSMISQSNNMLLMQPQSLNSLDSLLSQSGVQNVGVNIGNDGNDKNGRHQPPAPPKHQPHFLMDTSSNSSLIIDSRSLVSRHSSSHPPPPSPLSSHDHYIPISSLSSTSLTTHSASSTVSSCNFTLFSNQDSSMSDLSSQRIESTNSASQHLGQG